MTLPSDPHASPVLVRVGRRPDPLAFPDRAFVGAGRFDDPEGRVRTLYAAESLRACLIELLAPFRPDPELLATLAQVTGSGEPLPRGEVPLEWLASRLIGRLRIQPGQAWLDLRELETREVLRTELATTLVRLGLADLDVSAVRGPTRELTQEIARWARDRGFSGVIHTSRLADELQCWAIFEGAQFEHVGASEVVQSDDPDLIAAARDLSLIIPQHASGWVYSLLD